LAGGELRAGTLSEQDIESAVVASGVVRAVCRVS
jgi:hypothetical protein